MAKKKFVLRLCDSAHGLGASSHNLEQTILAISVHPWTLQAGCTVNAPNATFPQVDLPSVEWLVSVGALAALVASMFGSMFPMPRDQLYKIGLPGKLILGD